MADEDCIITLDTHPGPLILPPPVVEITSSDDDDEDAAMAMDDDDDGVEIAGGTSSDEYPMDLDASPADATAHDHESGSTGDDDTAGRDVYKSGTLLIRADDPLSGHPAVNVAPSVCSADAFQAHVPATTDDPPSCCHAVANAQARGPSSMAVDTAAPSDPSPAADDIDMGLGQQDPSRVPMTARAPAYLLPGGGAAEQQLWITQQQPVLGTAEQQFLCAMHCQVVIQEGADHRVVAGQHETESAEQRYGAEDEGKQFYGTIEVHQSMPPPLPPLQLEDTQPMTATGQHRQLPSQPPHVVPVPSSELNQITQLQQQQQAVDDATAAGNGGLDAGRGRLRELLDGLEVGTPHLVAFTPSYTNIYVHSCAKWVSSAAIFLDTFGHS